MNALPTTCTLCSRRECESSTIGTLDICFLGITYYKNNDEIIRNELMMPLRHIATNLRHEILPVLGIIHHELVNLDPRISSRVIETEKPTSNILGATIIMDLLINMIVGVTEFYPNEKVERGAQRRRSLDTIVHNFFAIYSLLRNRRRARDLKLQVDFGREVLIEYGSELIEYLLAVLIDNVWKYSKTESTVRIYLTPHTTDETLADLSIHNIGGHLPPDIDIFAAGAKGDLNSSGFGYGLHWATILVRQYNTLRPDSGKNSTSLTHKCITLSSQQVGHTFTLSNVLVKR